MTRSPSFARPVPPASESSPLVSAELPPQTARGAGGDFESAKYRKDFAGNGEGFSAYSECCDWLKARGFSMGPMHAGAPTAVMFGEVNIAKWRNLSPEDHEFLHGMITAANGSFRDGPVVLVIRRDSPSSVIEAFLADDVDKAAQAHVEGTQP